MRLIATVGFAAALLGCDLVFPLQAPSDARGDEDLIDGRAFDDAPFVQPGAPLITQFAATPNPVRVGGLPDLELVLLGTPSLATTYTLSADEPLASIDNSMNMVVLMTDGTGDVVTQLHPPPRFQNMVVTATIAYSATPTLKNSAPIQVPVEQEFGHPEIMGSAIQIHTNDILAMLVSIGPTPGHANFVGLNAKGVATKRIRGALFANDPSSSKPGTFITEFGPTLLPSASLSRIEIPIPGSPMVAGKLWIAVIAEDTTDIATAAGADASRPLRATGNFGMGLTAFPMSVMTETHDWGMFLVIGP